IRANREMRARLLSGMRLAKDIGWRRLADNEGIPVIIGTQHQMRCDWSALQWTAPFDLEQVTQLGRHIQLLSVCIQPDIVVCFALAQLNGAPAVRCLEAGKTDRKPQVRHLQETFERLAESVSQCLYCGRGYSLSAAPLEARRQLVLRRERAVRFI